MAALVILGIVIAACLTTAFIAWLDKRSTIRRSERARLSKVLMYRGLALERIEAEVDLQLQQNVAYHDVALVKTILTEHRRDMQSLDNKESRP